MKAVLTTTCLALLLAGCAVGPDYRRPAVDVPSGFRFQQPDASDAALDTEWWKDFGDPVLDGYVSEALEHNRNLAIAVANVDAAAAQLTIARASLFPTLDYQASASRGRSSSQQLLPGSQAGNSFELLGSTSWQIDLWGALRRQTEAAQALLAFAFLELGVDRIEACHGADNPASGRVMEKCGLLFEKERQDARYRQPLREYAADWAQIKNSIKSDRYKITN